jgi:hypothetical protein
LRRILDVSSQGAPAVAAWAAAFHDADPSANGELVLLAPQAGPRRLAKGVRSARFSPDGGSLAYEVDQPLEAAPPKTYVLELRTGDVKEIGALADPLWEADGRHLRATRTVGKDGRTPAARGRMMRARWDRQSGTTTIDGPGTAQIPAPAGKAVAWSEDQPATLASDSCTIFLNPWGGVRHSVEGKYCMGIADDRAVRWSPDGRGLAFPHPALTRDQGKSSQHFVDVVGIQGGRYAPLSVLRARARPDELAIAVAPGSVWFDWSPSGRLLALQDGASKLSVYDFEKHDVTLLGQGQRPTWSPSGSYLLILAPVPTAATSRTPLDGERSALEAFVLPGIAAAARSSLGPVRDARWLPAEACREQPPEPHPG